MIKVNLSVHVVFPLFRGLGFMHLTPLRTVCQTGQVIPVSAMTGQAVYKQVLGSFLCWRWCTDGAFDSKQAHSSAPHVLKRRNPHVL